MSEAGDGVGIAHLLKRSGHEATMWIKDDEGSKRCFGFVDRVDEWDYQPDGSDVVLADCTGSGCLLDLLRGSGAAVVGGSLLADRLEADRLFCNQVFDSVGIKRPRAELFTDWDLAEEYVRESIHRDVRLVFKPCGGLSGNLPSYVAIDAEDMLEMLSYYRSQLKGEPEFLLQDFIEGIDVSTEGWFDGRSFVEGMFNHTLETKRLLDQDTGPSGGCTGNVIWSAGSQGDVNNSNPLVGEIRKLEQFLKKENYGPGAIDLNSLVTDDGSILGLELTPRFGYDAIPALAYELFEGDFGGFLAGLSGVGPPADYQAELMEGFAAGVRVSISPWPAEQFHGPSGLPVRGLGKRPFEHFYPMDIMLNENEDYVTCGAWGIIGVATSWGMSIDQAIGGCLKNIKKLRIPDKQYRHDLAEVFGRKYNKLNRILAEKVA